MLGKLTGIVRDWRDEVPLLRRRTIQSHSVTDMYDLSWRLI